MKKYTVNIDRKVTVWQNEGITFEFDGSEEEARKLIEEHNGNVMGVPEFRDVQYDSWEYVSETEEEMTPEQNGGAPTHELIEFLED